MITLRGLEPSDAPAVARVSASADHATWAERIAPSDRRLSLGAFEGATLVGFGVLETQAAVRRKHVARIDVVAPEGTDALLLAALIDASDAWLGHLRLETTVEATLASRLALFERHGFVAEVRKRGELLRDDALTDAVGLGRVRPGFVMPAELGAPPAIPPRGPRVVPIVRERDARDAAQFARMHSDPSVMEGTWQLPHQTEAAWAARFASTPPGATVLVAELDGTIVASSGLFSMAPHAASFGISVHPSVQGRGVGDALMRAILDHADARGLKRVELDVYVDNDRARALYERHGFVVEGRCRAVAFRRGTYVDSFTMARVRL